MSMADGSAMIGTAGQLTRCRSCLMPTSRPSTSFTDGICSGCLNYRQRAEIDWAARKNDLHRIVESLKPNVDGVHAVVASSAGKDSHAITLRLLEMGIRPLVVTASTCMLTDVGRANIDNLARFAPTIEITPNRQVRAKLNRLSLELVFDSSWPEHSSIFAAPFRIAADMGISTVWYGENPCTEYGCPPGAEEQMLMNRRWIHEYGGLLGMRPADFVGMSGITAADMLFYTLPSDERMAKVDAHFLGQYLPWDSHENARLAVANGMTIPDYPPCSANWWRAENADGALIGLHDWEGYIKYGYCRGCAQLSIDIRYGLISREEAYEKLREIEGLFPFEYMGVSYKEVLDKIEISEDSFRKIIRQHVNRALFAEIDEANYRYTLREFA